MKIIDKKNLNLESNKNIAKYLGKDLELNDDFIIIIGEIDKDLKEKLSQSKSYILVINDKPLENEETNLNYIYVKDENLNDFLEDFINCLAGEGILNIDNVDIKCLISYNIAISEKNKNVEDLIKDLNIKLSPYNYAKEIIVIITGHNLSLFTCEDIVKRIKENFDSPYIAFAVSETLKDIIHTTVIIKTKDN